MGTWMEYATVPWRGREMVHATAFGMEYGMVPWTAYGRAPSRGNETDYATALGMAPGTVP